jgi:hypothetical protein
MRRRGSAVGDAPHGVSSSRSAVTHRFEPRVIAYKGAMSWRALSHKLQRLVNEFLSEPLHAPARSGECSASPAALTSTEDA